jgi:hypothetical protein
MRSLFVITLVAIGCSTPPAPDSGFGGGGAGPMEGLGGGGEGGGNVGAGGAGGGGESGEGGGTGNAGGGFVDAGGSGGGDAEVDAGVADSGVPDAGSPFDAGPAPGDGGFYGTVKCPNAAYLVCDDFEGNALDAQWTPVLSSGTVSIDATMAARGAHALHTVTTPNGGDALIALKTPIALAGQRLWGRMFVYVPSRLQAMLTSHTNIVTASGTNDLGANAVDAVWFGNGLLGSLFWQDNPGIDTSGLGLQTHVPTDRWFCVEWDFNGVAKELNVYLDDQLIPMSTLDGYHPPVNATVSVGVQFSLEEAWFDSVALSRTRIGCDG